MEAESTDAVTRYWPALVGVAPWVLQWFVGRWLGRTAAREDEREAEVTSTLHKLLEKVASIEGSTALLVERQASHQGELRQCNSRLEGLSANYAPRLAALEAGVVELRTIQRLVGTGK